MSIIEKSNFASLLSSNRYVTLIGFYRIIEVLQEYYSFDYD